MQEDYKKRFGDDAPAIRIVTTSAGRDRILKLIQDQEIDIKIWTENQLKQKIERGQTEVTSIIEGPALG